MKLVKGDKVAYSVAFLKSINALTGEIPRRRGVFLMYLKKGERVHHLVKWDDMPTESVVGDVLAKVGPNLRYCAC